MDRRNFLRNGLWAGGIVTLAGLNAAVLINMRRRRQPLSTQDPLGTPDRDVRTIAFSLSGNQLVSVTADRELSLWNSETGKVVFTRSSPLRGGATGVSLVNDGGWLAAVSEDRSLSLWNSSKQDHDADLFRLESEPTAVAFSPVMGGGDSSLSNSVVLAVSQENNTVGVFEYSDPNSPLAGLMVMNRSEGCCGQQFASPGQGFRQTRVLRPKDGGARSLVFSRDGHVLAAASGHDFLQVWATRNWSQFVIPTHLNAALHSTTFNFDGRLVAAGAVDGTVVILDWRNGRQIARLEGHGSTATGLAFCGVEDWIVVGYADGAIKIWPQRDAAEGLMVGKNPGKHTSLSMSADGERLASSWGMDVRFWKTTELLAAASDHFA